VVPGCEHNTTDNIYFLSLAWVYYLLYDVRLMPVSRVCNRERLTLLCFGWHHSAMGGGTSKDIDDPWHWSRRLILVGFDRYSAPLILVCFAFNGQSAPAPTQPESWQVKSHKPPLLALLAPRTSTETSPRPLHLCYLFTISKILAETRTAVDDDTLNHPSHYSAILNISLHSPPNWLPPLRRDYGHTGATKPAGRALGRIRNPATEEDF
jgi:hypothetical protein